MEANELERAIGMMRQWLNEDRITDPAKMVANLDLQHWLNKSIEELITKARREELEKLQGRMHCGLDEHLIEAELEGSRE